MGIFPRPRSASLGDTPKKLTKGEKRVAPSPPEDRLAKKGKGGTSPTYAAAARGQTPQNDEQWQLVERKTSGDVIRVSAKDVESYAEILKVMKEKVNPQNAGAEVLSIRRTHGVSPSKKSLRDW